jgi:hypothetical protein
MEVRSTAVEEHEHEAHHERVKDVEDAPILPILSPVDWEVLNEENGTRDNRQNFLEDRQLVPINEPQ